MSSGSKHKTPNICDDYEASPLYEPVISSPKLTAVNAPGFLEDLKKLADEFSQRGQHDDFAKLQAVIEKAQNSFFDSNESESLEVGASGVKRCKKCSGCLNSKKSDICQRCIGQTNLLKQKGVCDANVRSSPKIATQNHLKCKAENFNKYDNVFENDGVPVEKDSDIYPFEDDNISTEKARRTLFDPIESKTSLKIDDIIKHVALIKHVKNMSEENYVDKNSFNHFSESSKSSKHENESSNDFSESSNSTSILESISGIKKRKRKNSDAFVLYKDENESSDSYMRLPQALSTPQVPSKKPKLQSLKKFIPSSLSTKSCLKPTRRLKFNETVFETSDFPPDTKSFSVVESQKLQYYENDQNKHECETENNEGSNVSEPEFEDNKLANQEKEGLLSSESPLTLNSNIEGESTMQESESYSTYVLKKKPNRLNHHQILQLPKSDYVIDGEIGSNILICGRKFITTNVGHEERLLYSYKCASCFNKYKHNSKIYDMPGFIYVVAKSGDIHGDPLCPSNIPHICNKNSPKNQKVKQQPMRWKKFKKVSNIIVNGNEEQKYAEGELAFDGDSNMDNSHIEDVAKVNPQNERGKPRQKELKMNAARIRLLPKYEYEFEEEIGKTVMIEGQSFVDVTKGRVDTREYRSFQCRECKNAYGRSLRTKAKTANLPGYIYINLKIPEIRGDPLLPSGFPHICNIGQGIPLESSDNHEHERTTKMTTSKILQLPKIGRIVDENIGTKMIIHGIDFINQTKIVSVKTKESFSFQCRECTNLYKHNTNIYDAPGYLYIVAKTRDIHGDPLCPSNIPHICKKRSELENFEESIEGDEIDELESNEADEIDKLESNEDDLIDELESNEVGRVQSLFKSENDTTLTKEQFLEELFKENTIYPELRELLAELEKKFKYVNGNHQIYAIFTRRHGTIKEMIASIIWFGEAEELRPRFLQHVGSKNKPIHHVAEKQEIWMVPLLLDQNNIDKCKHLEALFQTFTALDELQVVKPDDLLNINNEEILNDELDEWAYNDENEHNEKHDMLKYGLIQMLHSAMRMDCNFLSSKDSLYIDNRGNIRRQRKARRRRSGKLRRLGGYKMKMLNKNLV